MCRAREICGLGEQEMWQRNKEGNVTRERMKTNTWT